VLVTSLKIKIRGLDRYSLCSITAAWLTPESNHTSSISVSFLKFLLPQPGQQAPSGTSLSQVRKTICSAPCFSTRFTI
jgi:hypothetical protein